MRATCSRTTCRWNRGAAGDFTGRAHQEGSLWHRNIQQHVCRRAAQRIRLHAIEPIRILGRQVGSIHRSLDERADRSTGDVSIAARDARLSLVERTNQLVVGLNAGEKPIDLFAKVRDRGHPRPTSRRWWLDGRCSDGRVIADSAEERRAAWAQPDFTRHLVDLDQIS